MYLLNAVHAPCELLSCMINSYPVIYDYLPFPSLFSVARNRKRAVAVGSSLKSNKKVSSLVDKASFFTTKSIYVFLIFFRFYTLDYFLFNVKLICRCLLIISGRQLKRSCSKRRKNLIVCMRS